MSNGLGLGVIRCVPLEASEAGPSVAEASPRSNSQMISTCTEWAGSKQRRIGGRKRKWGTTSLSSGTLKLKLDKIYVNFLITPEYPIGTYNFRFIIFHFEDLSEPQFKTKGKSISKGLEFCNFSKNKARNSL